MLLNEKIMRLGIFFFYDQDGIVDRYITYLLDDLVRSLDKLVIVCNGEISPAGRQIFAKYTPAIIVRENEGLDVWAYKTAMDSMGWEQLESFHEIILLNNTIMGPVYPFSEMFSVMNQRDLDFWGITKYGKEEFDPFGCIPYGYIPEHIQSHFMAFRKSLVSSLEFQEYWNHMPEIKTYKDSVGQHEAVFTKRFADLGFRWDVYINTDEYKGITTFPLNHYAMELIRDKRCPIFKRRNFFQDYDYVMGNTTGQPTMELYHYLKTTNLYDVNLIWDNILRTCHQEDFVQAMHLNYIIPSNFADYSKVNDILKTKKIALIMHLYFPDLIEDSYMHASYMPKEADIYITTNTEKKKRLIEETFFKLDCHHLEVRVIENRGRDVSSLLVGVKDVIENYDLACFVHDKKTSQIEPGSVGNGFAYKCYKNTLYNRAFVYNMIATFFENPRMGMLAPPMPNHAHYFPLLGYEWGPNFESTRNLAKSLNIEVPMSRDKMAIAPYGTFFWFRPKAMKPLLDKGWQYKDFPPEPNNIDGTILHAIERIYPFVVQQAGYYPGIVLSDQFAKIEYTNLLYYARGYNQSMIKTGTQAQFPQMRQAIEYAAYSCNLEKEDEVKKFQHEYELEKGREIQQLQSICNQKEEQIRGLQMECERLSFLVGDLYPKTSIKYQIKDRLKKLFHLTKDR